MGKSGEFLEEKIGRGNFRAFCNKTNHQEHGFSGPMSPTNTLWDEILTYGHCDTLTHEVQLPSSCFSHSFRLQLRGGERASSLHWGRADTELLLLRQDTQVVQLY